jgi:hypothetical protein
MSIKYNWSSVSLKCEEDVALKKKTIFMKDVKQFKQLVQVPLVSIMEFVLLIHHRAIAQHVVYVLKIILVNTVKLHYFHLILVHKILVDITVLAFEH